MKYNKIIWFAILSIFVVGVTLISIGGLMFFIEYLGNLFN